MICPLCQETMDEPLVKEELWSGETCQQCSAYEIQWWDGQIQFEAATIQLNNERYRVIFDHAKRETQIQIYKFHDKPIGGQEYTAHLLTLPYIANVPTAKELQRKLSVWLTFQ